MIRELEERIPELFIGPVCPNPRWSCSCKKTCQAMVGPEELFGTFTKSLLDNLKTA